MARREHNMGVWVALVIMHGKIGNHAFVNKNFPVYTPEVGLFVLPNQILFEARPRFPAPTVRHTVFPWLRRRSKGPACPQIPAARFREELFHYAQPRVFVCSRGLFRRHRPQVPRPSDMPPRLSPVTFPLPDTPPNQQQTAPIRAR